MTGQISSGVLRRWAAHLMRGAPAWTVAAVCTWAAHSPVMASPLDSAAIVLAVVNDDTVFAADVDRLLIDTHRSLAASERQGFDYERLLTRLVNERLLVQEAIALGIDQDQQLINQLEQEREERAARLWVRDRFKPITSVPEDTVLQYFRENFHRLQYRMIACHTEDEAASARTAVLAGESMDSVARVRSVDHYRDRGGLHRSSWYVDIDPVIRQVSDTLPVGQVSAVFPHRGLYAVLRVEEAPPADTSELHLVRAQIETWFVKQENERAWQAFLEPVRRQYPANDDREALERIRADSSKLFTPEFAVGTADFVMRFGDRVAITDQEFRKELSHSAMVAGTTPFDELFAKTYEDLTVKHTVAAAAYADGYDQHKEVVDAFRRSLDSALVAICIAETVTPRIVFNHAEFEEFHRQHPEEFRRPDQFQFEEMTVDSESVAMEIYGRLAEGADFAYVARQYSARRPTVQDASEYVDISTLPQTLQDQIRDMGLGGVPRPMQTEDGWLILKIRNRKAGEELPLEEAETRLRNIMFQKKFNEELDSVLSILRSNANVKYNDEAIRAYFGNDS